MGVTQLIWGVTALPLPRGDGLGLLRYRRHVVSHTQVVLGAFGMCCSWHGPP
jgi:hypothetical protein